MPSTTKMELEGYLRKVAEYHHQWNKNGNIRVGQAYFNCLPEHIAKDIAGSDIDPFHDDSKLPQFFAYLSVVMQ